MKLTPELLRNALKFIQTRMYVDADSEKGKLIASIKNYIAVHGEIDSVVINEGRYGDCGRKAMSFIGKLNADSVTDYSIYLDTNEVYSSFDLHYENIHFNILTTILEVIQEQL